ncbi:MAG: ribosome silencing factor [Pseudomonadota bacterium]
MTLPAQITEPNSAKPVSLDDIHALSDTLIASLEDDKAEDLTIIDITEKSSIADQMIIASGRSARHVASIADHISQKVKERTGRAPKLEGLPNADWVLIDLGDIILHLFRPEVRAFYNLEKIWGDDASNHREQRH